MTKLKLAYFGTPDFSADLLEKLITDVSINRLIDIKCVVTQPDRPVGRKQVITPSPTKVVAQKFGLKIEYLKFNKNLKLKIKNCDLVLLYAFGQMIPRDILSTPKMGFWNIHPSLLPKYRGPSPIAYPLINGDTKTGVTLIKMDEKIDHGPIIAQEELEISPTDRRPDLEKKLTNLAFKIFKRVVKGEEACFEQIAWAPLGEAGEKHGIKPFTEQNHSQATYTKLFEKQDGFISFENLKLALSGVEGLKIENSPEKLFNLFRGLYPWPGLWTLLRPAKGGTSEGQTLKRMKITDINFKDGKLIIKKVQLEGKKEVDFETFQKAYGILNKLPIK